jgi:hypothetical protein
MGQPSEFTSAQDYADFQTNNPGSFVAGSDLDVDFAAVKVTLDQIRTNLALLQKDDGTIGNAVVTVDSLNADLLALFTIGASTVRGQWLTATAYAVLDVVTDSGIVYVCAEAHTSGVLATDVTAVKWLVLSGGSQPLDTDLTAIAALVSAADKIPYATGAGTWSLASFTAYARTLLALSSKAAVIAELSVAVTNAANTFTGGQSFSGDTIPQAKIVGRASDDLAQFRLFGNNGTTQQGVIQSNGDKLEIYGPGDALGLSAGPNTDPGVLVGAATGGFQGTGSVNASAFYDDGVLINSATQAEMESASDTTIGAIVTAGNLIQSPLVPKVLGLITISGGVPTLESDSVGISSITDHGGNGQFSIVFTTAFSAATFKYFFGAGINGSTQVPKLVNVSSVGGNGRSVSACRIMTKLANGTDSDIEEFSVAIWGDQA